MSNEYDYEYDEYANNDGLLENIQQEREAWLRRRQNHNADPQANDVRDALKTFAYNS